MVEVGRLIKCRSIAGVSLGLAVLESGYGDEGGTVLREKVAFGGVVVVTELFSFGGSLHVHQALLRSGP